MSTSRFLVAVICVVFVAVSVRADCSIPFPVPCTTLQGLSFCSMMNGRQATSLQSALGQTYSQFMDNALGIAFQSITTQIQTIATQHGFTVCQSCLDNLQTLLCAGAFPQCGFISCMYSAAISVVASSCPALCPCSGSCCFTGCTLPNNPNFNPNDALNCASSLLNANLPQQILGQCSSFLVSQQACMSWINTCTCNQMSVAQQQQACSIYSPSGFTISMPGAANACTGTSWCGVVGSLSEEENMNQYAAKLASLLSRVQDFVGGSGEHTEAYDNCANPNLCFSAPMPAAVGAFAVAGGSGSPSFTSPTVNVFSNGATVTSSTGAIVGGVLGGLAGLAVIITIVVLLVRRNGRKKETAPANTQMAQPFLAMK